MEMAYISKFSTPLFFHLTPKSNFTIAAELSLTFDKISKIELSSAIKKFKFFPTMKGNDVPQ